MEKLKNYAIAHSLFPPTSLQAAVARLQFIQIDPIRSPAPAQDLILRQRVLNYHVGDIALQSENLKLEEDFLYAHGYMTQEVWRLLQPRSKIELTAFDTQVLEVVSQLAEIKPSDLERHFDKKRERNWWGGYLGQSQNYPQQTKC